jgi:hypothetical protein
MTGSDWRAYELMYNYLNDTTKNISKEPGYRLYNQIFSFLGFNFWNFFILTKCLCFIVSIHFLKKLSSSKFCFGLLVFYGVFSLGQYINNPMRNLISGVIYLFSYKYIYRRNFVKYLIITIIAALFHLSALFTLPFYFINIKSIKNRWIFLVALFVFIFAVFYQNMTRDFFLAVNTITGILDNNIIKNRGTQYLSQDVDGSFSIGLLVNIFLFIIIMHNKEKILKMSKYGLILINFSSIYFFINLLGYASPVFTRFKLFVFIPYVANLSLLLHSNVIKKYYRYFILFAIIIWSSGSMISTITNGYQYIPYSNYISYIFDQPDYRYRDEYNLKYSPYK